MRSPATLLVTLLAAFNLFGQSPVRGQSQEITISERSAIPGMELKPGSYVFHVEDTLQDRAIVRITDAGGKYTLVLAVPNARLPQGGSNGLIGFDTSKSDKRVLRGWACPGCAAPLEFVYPKLQAAGITGITTEPVIAVDPSYDKLPANLSPDDMKVVTLWLLTPKPITAQDQAKGVVAKKYVPAELSSVQNADPTTAAPAVSSQAAPPAPAAAVSTNGQPATAMNATNPVAPGAAAGGRTHLPKTGTNTFQLLLTGLALIFLGAALRFANSRKLTRTVRMSGHRIDS